MKESVNEAQEGTPIVITPEIAYRFTRKYGPNEDLEPLIATDARYSFWYAKYVLRGAFPLGETIILSNRDINAQYVDDVLNYDFEESDRIYREALKSVNGKVELL